MSKALKNTLIILLSALLLFSCAFPLLNSTIVYADELSSDTQQSSDHSHLEYKQLHMNNENICIVLHCNLVVKWEAGTKKEHKD